MSSNVGLSTPRGSGTSGYVQRNWAFVKPRSTGYGAPYPPTQRRDGDNDRNDASYPGNRFKQRQPDKKILEHDRRRQIEVEVMEERERLEEENEKLLQRQRQQQQQQPAPTVLDGGSGSPGPSSAKEQDMEQEKALSEEEIDEKCDELRQKLLKQLEQDQQGGRSKSTSVSAAGGGFSSRRNFKSYQVHELAEAKIEESERLRRALGLKENKETGEISSMDWKKRPQQRGEWSSDRGKGRDGDRYRDMN